MAFRNNRHRLPAYAPKSRTGYLYYARLRTDVGIYYKVGFTSLRSVEHRLSYSGVGDEKYIDEVLLFVWLDNGFDIEQQIHSEFGDKRCFGSLGNTVGLPLAGNGQSELYARDILKLDSKFTDEQERQTLALLRAERERINPPKELDGLERFLFEIAPVVLVPLGKILLYPIFYIFMGLEILFMGPKQWKAQRAAQRAGYQKIRDESRMREDNLVKRVHRIKAYASESVASPSFSSAVSD